MVFGIHEFFPPPTVVPSEDEVGGLEDHLVEGLPVQGAHGVDLHVGEEAGLAEGVAACRVKIDQNPKTKGQTQTRIKE